MQLAPLGVRFGLSDRWIYRIPVQWTPSRRHRAFPLCRIYRIPVQILCLKADGPFPSRIYRIPVQLALARP
jgi:hypothetical protein